MDTYEDIERFFDYLAEVDKNHYTTSPDFSVAMPDGTIKNITAAQRDELIEKKEISLKRVPKFEGRKIDISTRLICFERILDKYPSENVELSNQLYIDVKNLIKRMKTAYISPAFYLNQYLDKIIAYNIGLINRSDTSETDYALLSFNVYINSILISYKTLLDRLVFPFSFYFSGVSINSTFGRIEKGKGRGLMSYILENKETDKLLEELYDFYIVEAQAMIRPRDTIIHYNDLYTKYGYPADGTIIPQHYYERLFHGEPEEDDFLYYGYISDHIHSLYEIIDKVLIELSGRKINYRKCHIKTDNN